jgi:hypothetical protein
MKIQRLITASLLAVLLATGASQAGDKARKKGQQPTFGFTGQVDAFNRGGGMLVVEDMVFRVDESTRVHKRRGAKGTLSDITPGTRIGFYPRSGASSDINEIWILPRNWKAQPGFAVTPDE